MTKQPGTACKVILFTSPHCAYCPAISKIFSALNEQGLLSEFKKYDLTTHPSLAEKFNVRSVPWFKINSLEFFGSHTPAEIEYWVTHSSTPAGILRYITETLEAGQLNQIENLIRKHPDWLAISLQILADTTSPIQARIGLGAVIESFAGDEILLTILPSLEVLLADADHRVRADACHYLGMIPSNKIKGLLTSCLSDEHPEVREVAEDGLELIQSD
ncbi:hypothetical protein MNBD_GAMMA21-2862 [hydrothermal vent metagenome]|uniref:Thioredoxin domain-containing protein n=1 Tax=hydrothermal vent metagenome TaxID=652676 RepID=A0A3B1AGI3_9ZZZZ